MAQSKLEKISNYAVILIALSALVVSIWQVRLFQDHNKLTVRPYLDSHIVQEDSMLVVSFSNKGLGPAIIEKITYQINGKEYTSLVKLLEESGEKGNILRTFNYYRKSVISSGERKLLAKLANRDMRGVRVKIVYKSIYEEEDLIVFNF